MFDVARALKLAVVVTVALVLPTTIVVYKKGVLTKLPNFPKKEDCDYQLDQPQSCSLAVPQKECIYEPNLCYVNIWALAKKIKNENPEELKNMYAVFMASSAGLMPAWLQTNGFGESGFNAWDYHVIMVYSKDKSGWVFDFDSRLSFPEELRSYCKKTFLIESKLLQSFQPLFRVIKAENYLEMFDPKRDAQYMHSIKETALYNNYITMKQGQPYSEQFGEVLDRSQFIEKFS